MRRLRHAPVVFGHLVARFVTSLSPRPPRTTDEVWAEDHLSPGELALWRQMTNQDRRHSAAVARRFVRHRPAATRDEIAGALLHDVGKIRCRLGTFGRSVATMIGPRTERFRAYHDHEEIGADLVAQAGSPSATVELVAGAGPAFDALKASDHA
ncbi:hypothetical protein BH23ACT3_BH23ACT3_11320 [soil metagenome]